MEKTENKENILKSQKKIEKILEDVKKYSHEILVELFTSIPELKTIMIDYSLGNGENTISGVNSVKFPEKITNSLELSSYLEDDEAVFLSYSLECGVKLEDLIFLTQTVFDLPSSVWDNFPSILVREHYIK